MGFIKRYDDILKDVQGISHDILTDVQGIRHDILTDVQDAYV
jgi:hypothetical protein